MDDRPGGSEVAFEDGLHLRAVLDSLGEGVVVQDTQGRVQFLNVKAAEILGVEARDVIGRTSAEAGWSPLDEKGRPVGPESHPGFASLARGTPVMGVIVQHDRPGGERRWLEVSSFPLASGDRAPNALVTVLSDVTDRREDAESLRTQATVLDSVGQAVIVVGVDQRVRYWNRAAEELYGWSAKEAVGRNVLELTTSEDQAGRAEEITSALLRGESWTGVFWSRHRDGTRFPVLVTDTPVLGDHGELVAIIGVTTDISERVAAEAQNRRLSQIVQSSRDGHPPTDTVARLAADEFFVVSDGSPSSRSSVAMAQSLQVTLAEPFRIQGREVSITVSIGVVDLEPGNEPSQATRAATDAMGQAKLGGRAQIVSRQSGPLRTGLASRLDMVTALGRAVERNELRIHYQPVIDLASSEVSGFEALVRWEHPDRGLLLPGEFIQLAEDTGLILSIGGWVLGKAIRLLAAWRADGAALTMAVNISAHQLRTSSLLTTLSGHLDQHQVPADTVHLEITETVLMDDVFNSIERLTTLRSTGVRIDIDDFGTGYSSLSYLRRLPINGLKVDRSFIDGLGRDEDDSAIARAIVGLGLALHLDVIAEGVETQAQAQQLGALGCPSAQGYLWSPALPPEEAVSLIGTDIARPR